MKIEEIWVAPGRDELSYANHDPKFINADIVATIQNLTLKRAKDGDEIYYGLFNKNNVVGYFHITKFDDTKYQVVSSELLNPYRGQGYGTFLYDFCVLNDKITLISDNRQSPSAKKLWDRLRATGHANIQPFSLSQNKVVDATPDQVYANSDDLVWIASPTGKTINESLYEINKKYQGMRYIVWYGPGTTSEDYFNY